MVAVEPDFCHQCGAELIEREVHDRQRAYCPTCERPFFRNAVPSAGVVVRDGGSVLLMQQAERDSEWATGREWTLPGGHPSTTSRRERAQFENSKRRRVSEPIRATSRCSQHPTAPTAATTTT